MTTLYAVLAGLVATLIGAGGIAWGFYKAGTNAGLKADESAARRVADAEGNLSSDPAVLAQQLRDGSGKL